LFESQTLSCIYLSEGGHIGELNSYSVHDQDRFGLFNITDLSILGEYKDEVGGSECKVDGKWVAQ
jgi:hypothetical protein